MNGLGWKSLCGPIIYLVLIIYFLPYWGPRGLGFIWLLTFASKKTKNCAFVRIFVIFWFLLHFFRFSSLNNNVLTLEVGWKENWDFYHVYAAAINVKSDRDWVGKSWRNSLLDIFSCISSLFHSKTFPIYFPNLENETFQRLNKMKMNKEPKIKTQLLFIVSSKSFSNKKEK